MSTIRRAVTLIGLAVAITVAGSFPASATFSETVGITTAVGTATIAPPTQVEALTICTTTVDPVTQVATTTTELKVEWWQSTSPHAIGYRITVHPADGPAYTLAVTGPTDEEFVSSDSVVGADPRISVTTLTGTTWTAESGRTPIKPC